MSKTPEAVQFSLTFGEDFMKQHAGQIITDQSFAIVELIANAWDAGSTEVNISWPNETEQVKLFKICDNGIGMSHDQLLYRWGNLNYNRIIEQGGKEAVFPTGTKGVSNRLVFGRNGVGRHAMFYFNDEYSLKTTKEEKQTEILVKRASGATPYNVYDVKEKKAKGVKSGTCISCTVNPTVNIFDQQRIIELIGSRFMADPSFKVKVNGHLVDFTDISHLTTTYPITIGDVSIQIHRIIADKGRNTKQSGIAYWNKGRLVGNPSWTSKFDQGSIIDGRHPVAKTVLYIIETNHLDNVVKSDWSGFYVNEGVLSFFYGVEEFIKNDLRDLLFETRKDRKELALHENRKNIEILDRFSKETIEEFVDLIQDSCPTISPSELQASVEILAKLEKSKSGYDLLEKLSTLTPEDLDDLNEILEKWSVSDAKKVLSELKWRLELIDKLQGLSGDITADELHDLQPVFDRGLWIFGPEFESIDFLSNRTLSTILKNFFSNVVVDRPARRPDIIALPNGSVGIYSRDSFDSNHQVNGLEKVVIIELKRAGVPIGPNEKDQALGYCRALRQSNQLNSSTKILAYVLGSQIDRNYESEIVEGEITVRPVLFSTILSAAHARTFQLMKKIEEIKGITLDAPQDTLVEDLDLFTSVQESEIKE